MGTIFIEVIKNMQTNNEIQTLCENMKLLRATLGLSKKEMANRIRISMYSLNKLESGVMPPRLCIDFLIYINWEFGILPSQMVNPNLGMEQSAD